MQQFRKSIYRQNTSVDSFQFNLSDGKTSAGLACQEIIFPITVYCVDSSLIILSRVYLNDDLTGNFNGLNRWYKLGDYSYQINSIGEIVTISDACSTLLPLSRYCYKGLYPEDDPIHNPPGGVINWQDEYGNPQTVSGISQESGIYSVWSSILPTHNSAAFRVDCTTGEVIPDV